MCPACISTATLVVAGTVSAGGMSALVVKLVHAIKTRTTIVQRKSKVRTRNDNNDDNPHR
jgi:hypothetical protein